MKKIVKFSLIAAIMLHSSSAHAFKFDVWESGMSEDEISRTAKENGIKLTGSETRYSYQTKLLNENANVSLLLTKGDFKLKEVLINWSMQKKLVPLLKGIIEDKNPIYKNYHPEYRLIMCERYEYLLDKNTSVNIEVRFISIVEMTYKDLKLSEIDEKRKSFEKKETQRKTVMQDQGKFFGEVDGKQKSDESESRIYKWTDSKGIVHYTNTPGNDESAKSLENIKLKQADKISGYVVHLKNGKKINCDWVKMNGKTVQFMEGAIQTELPKEEINAVEEEYEAGGETKSRILRPK